MPAVESSSPSFTIFPGIAPLARRYDGFVLDLWGVVHDGVAAFPWAVETLRKIGEAKKPVVFLSNAPRRVGVLSDAMEKMGISRALYRAVISSGEAVYAELSRRDDPWYRALGRGCLHLGPERDHNMLDGLGLEIVDETRATFILNTGPWNDDDRVADYETRLAAWAKRGLKMICANPDLEVLRGGKRIICAGALATRYEELGGDVAYKGKPWPEIYRDALKALGLPDRGRVLAVGDSIGTDLRGAKSAGIDALLVLDGLHGAEWGLGGEILPDPNLLGRRAAEACRGAGVSPLGAIHRFVW